MRSLCNWLAGIILAGILVGLTSGCGGGGGDLAKPPPVDPSVKQDMSNMPGYDPKTGTMKTK